MIKYKIQTAYLLILGCLFFNCLGSENLEERYIERGVEVSNPFVVGKPGLAMGSPEAGLSYTRDGIRFNWDVDLADVFFIYIASAPLKFSNGKISESSNIIAAWHSLLPVLSGSGPGFLKPDSFRIFENNSISENSFTFVTGQYYVVTLAYDKFGELTYSSQQIYFIIL